MDRNICRFIQTKNIKDSLNIINFVYEKIADFKHTFITSASNTLYMVTAGEGILHTTYGDFSICHGDLFLTFSSKPYYIENCKGLQYIYISFIGSRTTGLLERLVIRPSSPVSSNHHFLCEKWHSDFNCANSSNMDLICESLILYSFSFLCKTIKESKEELKLNNVMNIKQYIEQHYTDEDINLKAISKKFNYNSKYISSAFIKLTKITFKEYVRSLRMNHAMSLINQGYESIKDIAIQSGYADALYFSKVFYKYFGLYPRTYIKNNRTALDNRADGRSSHSDPKELSCRETVTDYSSGQ